LGLLILYGLTMEGIKISDFKSGAYRHDHREQVLMYALLLKSHLECLPKEAFIVYPDKSERVEIDKDTVNNALHDLENKICNANRELNTVPAKSKSQ